MINNQKIIKIAKSDPNHIICACMSNNIVKYGFIVKPVALVQKNVADCDNFTEVLQHSFLQSKTDIKR
jgi:hypothetical protein